MEAPSFGASAAGALMAFPPHHLELSQCFSHNTELIHVASEFLFPRPLSSQWLSFMQNPYVVISAGVFLHMSLGINPTHL